MNPICALFFVLAATVAPPPHDTTELARVNGEPITVNDLISQFKDRHGGHTKFLGGEEEARRFLNIVIDERLLMQEAYELGLDQDQDIRRRADAYEKEAAAKYLVKSEVEDRAAVSPQEVEAAWKEYTTFLLHVRQIVVDTPEEAEEVRRAIVGGGDFDAMARNCSHAESRMRGGRVLIAWGSKSPQWESIVFKLQDGELSPVIRTDEGYEVDLLQERVDAKQPPFEKASSAVEAVLKQRKLDARKKAFSDELWSTYHVARQPIDWSPSSILVALKRAPETVVATWDGGGKLTLKDAVMANDIRNFALLPPVPRQNAIDARLRSTVNSLLVDAEAVRKKVAELPEIQDDVRSVRERLMEQALYGQHILKDVSVSDDEVRKYYDAHQPEIFEPELRHVAHLLVRTEAEAKALRQKLVSGGDFKAAAKESSLDSQTAHAGGDLGWIKKEDVPKAFTAVLTMALGEITQPIAFDSGFDLVKVLEIQPRRQLAFDEVKEKVRQQALEEKKRAARKFWIEKLRAASKIEIREAAINTYVKEHRFEPPKEMPMSH